MHSIRSYNDLQTYVLYSSYILLQYGYQERKEEIFLSLK